MNDYEKFRNIERICKWLEAADKAESYSEWLDSSVPELRELLKADEFASLEKIRTVNPFWETRRQAQQEFLDTLREQHRQYWLDGIYALSSYASDDHNFTRFKDGWESNRKKLVVFLGAGASLGARNGQDEPLPSATRLRNLIAEEFLPDESPNEMTLEQVSARAEAHRDRPSLDNFVASLLEEAKPRWQHAALPFLFPLEVFTTNYDDLIEQGWALHKQNDKVPSPCSIFKPHGSLGLVDNDIGEGGLVLTTFDYFKMLGRNKEMIDQFLQGVEGHCVLFVGYSLSDMDIGSHLWDKRQSGKKVNWYAVFPGDDLTRDMYAEEFGVRVINRKFHEFVKELDETVDFIPGEWKFEEIPRLREQGLIG